MPGSVGFRRLRDEYETGSSSRYGQVRHRSRQLAQSQKDKTEGHRSTGAESLPKMLIVGARVIPSDPPFCSLALSLSLLFWLFPPGTVTAPKCNDFSHTRQILPGSGAMHLEKGPGHGGA